MVNVLDDYKLETDEYKKLLKSYSLYNFLEDYLRNVDPKAGFFYWDETDEEFTFQTDDDALCDAIIDAGYTEVWEDE